MQIVNRKIIEKAMVKHPETKTQLTFWLLSVESAKWRDPNDLFAQYPSAQYVPVSQYKFQILGGNYRLMTVVEFTAQTVLVKSFGTHSEYDRKTQKTRKQR